MRFKVMVLFLTMLFISTTILAASLKVTWNANTETDLAGYKVYYALPTEWTLNTETNQWIHNGTYPSVVDVGNVNEYILPNITEGAYGFVVTAYDTSGNESDGSLPVSYFFNLPTLQIAPPVSNAFSVPSGATLERIDN